MSKLNRLLVFRITKYQENNPDIIKLYKEIYGNKICKEFNKIKKHDIDILLGRIINNEYAVCKKYPSIVEFVKNYKDNYLDELDIFFSDIYNYYHDITDSSIFESIYSEFSKNTVDVIKSIRFDTFEIIKLNISILIDTRITYDEILNELKKCYPENINPKLDAIYEISVYFLDLYFKYNKQIDEFKFRYGQEECYEIFKQKLELPKYWGLMIAPTGWGKSMMHYLFIGYFFSKFKKNVLLVTKRKDILVDVIIEIEEEVSKLKKINMFPNIEIEIYDQVSKKLDYKEINKHTEYTVIITNTDKLITRNKNDDKFNSTKMDRIKWDNFGLVLFDEVHWAGSKRTVQFMDYLKNKIPYGIGSSATPIRKSLNNQENIQKLYGDNYDVMYELSYVDAWHNDVILKVDTVMFPVYEEHNIKNKNNECEIKPKSKKIIVDKINDTLKKSYKKKIIVFFKSRLSLLEWYKYLKKNNYLNELSFHMSFTYSGYSKIDDSEDLSLDNQVTKKINSLKINTKDIDNGIDNFKKEKSNAVLLVIGRANEGFNDPLVDICVNLDFSKNGCMLLTLQKMGRTQRLHGDKQKGYYICPVISDDKTEFQSMIAQSLYNYIKATSENSTTNNSKCKVISAKSMSEIIETFKVEGYDDYTHEDIMKRIRQMEKEKAMTLQQFIENLKTYKITNHDEYNKVWLEDEEFRVLGMPRFYESISDFSWNMINDDDYYGENEIVTVIKKTYYENKKEIDKLKYNNKKIQYIHNLDNKIPPQIPWKYYNINKTKFSFIYN